MPQRPVAGLRRIDTDWTLNGPYIPYGQCWASATTTRDRGRGNVRASSRAQALGPPRGQAPGPRKGPVSELGKTDEGILYLRREGRREEKTLRAADARRRPARARGARRPGRARGRARAENGRERGERGEREQEGEGGEGERRRTKGEEGQEERRETGKEERGETKLQRACPSCR